MNLKFTNTTYIINRLYYEETTVFSVQRVSTTRVFKVTECLFPENIYTLQGSKQMKINVTLRILITFKISLV